ncbi:MAG: hypothetical protein GF398_17345 [Chitinivibrionales bacterium]|nr:hypothetical protein [Chitinivibrionales bacterium]
MNILIEFRFRVLIALAAGSALLCQCDLFGVRPAESPDAVRSDPLEFKEILRGTNARFTKSTYEDIFHDKLIYEDARGKQKGKDQLVTRLNWIVDKYIGPDETNTYRLNVRWSMFNDSTRIFNKNDTASIFRKSKTASTQFGDTLVSTHHFKLVFIDVKNTWSIVFWKDTPESELSFFDPAFVDPF